MLNARALSHNGSTITFLFDDPDTCPICGKSIFPDTVYTDCFDGNDGILHAVLLYRCPSCANSFMAQYELFHLDNPRSLKNRIATLEYVCPTMPKRKEFDKKLEEVSPSFVKIYNQALAAEDYELDEIAGIGYRKAIEFLVKDFCKKQNPDDAERIERMPLDNCIKTYVHNPDIQVLATRAVWIGNDETHYIRKHEDLDIEQMKSFIEAMVYFIGMSLAVESAAAIQRR